MLTSINPDGLVSHLGNSPILAQVWATGWSKTHLSGFNVLNHCKVQPVCDKIEGNQVELNKYDLRSLSQ